uniref:Oxidative stress-responsive serine-rich protein 1 n=1 Tax=Dermatophagoides pteronyssinus TaxID=6956 RepID=A0A6P6Y585_DERPT|nr:myb-like protein I [Dermatophagoides pteronyssinus]
MNSLFVEDTANVHQNNVIIDEKLCNNFDLKNIELKFEHLMIDKKRSKFKIYRILLAKENGKNSKIKSANNLKKRSLLILENNDYIEYLIKNNDNDDNCCSSPTEKLMYDINDKMASLWTKNGYRNSNNENNNDCGHQQATATDNLNNDKTNTEISSSSNQQQTCAQQATLYDNCDSSLVIELAAYLDETLYIPKKMSFMAEMMYT